MAYDSLHCAFLVMTVVCRPCSAMLFLPNVDLNVVNDADNILCRDKLIGDR